MGRSIMIRIKGEGRERGRGKETDGWSATGENRMEGEVEGRK